MSHGVRLHRVAQRELDEATEYYDLTIPFRPVARSASGSTRSEKADMARRARRGCHPRRPPGGARPLAGRRLSAAAVGAAGAAAAG